MEDTSSFGLAQVKVEGLARAEAVIDPENQHAFDPARVFNAADVNRLEPHAFDELCDRCLGSIAVAGQRNCYRTP